MPAMVGRQEQDEEGECSQVDAGKVAAVRAALASGTYVIDPQLIAAAIIARDLPPPARTNKVK